MATTEEGFCSSDADCFGEQYCYQVSKRCVDYTRCSRYNREENQKRSRSPSQCGPCLPDYTAEKLSTGEIAALCRKTNVNVGPPETPQSNYHLITYITVGVLVALLITAIGGLFIRMRSRRRPKHQRDPEKSIELCAIKPSAPPIEGYTMMDCKERVMYVPCNNNGNFKNKNGLVCASGFKAPDWIRLNPNYDNNLHNDNNDQLHAGTELQPNQEQPVVTPEAEYNIEIIDNNANSILSNDNILENNGNNSNHNSTPENNSEENRRRGWALNILLILLNVKILNGD